ncbi:hypothetical protein GOP47_0022704 [Adiantum capillus-veneris]|uniref:Uncharacterized protein n=1 Tax=Adiantum capillus-veneris TaxID=13818 RepID=A0A9D4U6B4_ADICA|nr:hypothetical protein GOP47_0022704 [Adiantum capillus-veneris]
MWTMHDYPGFGEIFGLSTSGHNACSTCGLSLVTERPDSLRKMLQFILPMSMYICRDNKVRDTIFKLRELVRFVSSKEIKIYAIPAAQTLATETAKARGEDIANKEWEYARGCVPKCLSFNSMWSKGRHFRTRHIDERRTTMDCAIMENFDIDDDEAR